MKTLKFLFLALFVSTITYAQEELEVVEEETSNIQKYTPSKLLEKGKWDIKWFNNLYTQTESTFTDGDEPRQTFFTSTVETFTGISDNNRWNVGLILEFRSNVINDRSAFDVFSFDGETGTARSGFTSIAPAVKFNPIKSVGNFTIQSALFIPLVDNEQEDGSSTTSAVFLDNKSWIWQNRFFYDYNFWNNKWQIFTELNAEYFFGDDSLQDDFQNTIEGGFANNSLNLTPGVFLSYFPSNKFTILGLAQFSQRIDLGNDFDQNFLALGGGLKYQLSDVINLEGLYTNFVTGNNTGLGETYNIGLRFIF